MGNTEKMAARTPELDATETVIRAMGEFDKDEVERVVIIALSKDGYRLGLYSNARSEPEMNGMIWEAQNFQEDLLDHED